MTLSSCFSSLQISSPIHNSGDRFPFPCNFRHKRLKVIQRHPGITRGQSYPSGFKNPLGFHPPISIYIPLIFLKLFRGKAINNGRSPRRSFFTRGLFCGYYVVSIAVIKSILVCLSSYINCLFLVKGLFSQVL